MNCIFRRHFNGLSRKILSSSSDTSEAFLKRFSSNMMRAICMEEFGPPEVLKIKEIPKPSPEKSEVLVKVYTAGVNPVDTYIRQGAFTNLPALPAILGKEAAGIVEQVGEGVTKFKVGDRVVCCFPCEGGYAEYVKCNETKTIKLSDKLSFSQGTALYVAYFTAVRALITKCKLKRGDRLLVHGASGAVGTAAIQIASSLGAEIVGTAGTSSGLDLVKSMGAHQVYNHRVKDYISELISSPGFDVILENSAHINLGTDLNLLKNDGRIAIVGSRGPIEVDPRLAINTEAQIYGVKLFAVNEVEFEEYSAFINEAVEKGFIFPHIGLEYDMSKAPEAHRRLMSDEGAQGKLVLRIRS